ncbi:MAG: hypothetical protein ACKO5C_09405, partial [Ferruginibacter sp.]
YHGVLILFFTLISNRSLFRSTRVYAAGLLAFLLFTPHLWWQYQHDFVSFQYHLKESNVNPYKITYTIEYVLGQLFLPGPLIGLLLLPAAWLYRARLPLEKALRYTVIGVYVFFLISSFRGKVEANWTAPALIPLILLAHGYLSDRSTWSIWIQRLVLPSLFLILLLRISLMVDVLPVKAVATRFHSWKNWPDTLKKRTNGLPAVWLNSYQRAAKYSFYAGVPTHSLNLYRERRNNYNFWPIEDSLQGRAVAIMHLFDMQQFRDSIQTPLGWVGYRIDSSFQGTCKYWFKPFTNKIEVQSGDSVRIAGNFLPAPAGGKIEACRIGVFQKGKWIMDWLIPQACWYLSSDGYYFSVAVHQSLAPGNYVLIFSLNAAGLPPTHNSQKIQLTVR